MGGGSGGGQQTSTSKVELPSWLETAAQDYIGAGTTVANRPYEAYTGEQIAGFAPDQLNVYQGVRDSQGVAGGALAGLAGQAAGYSGYQPQQANAQSVQAGSLPQTDLSGYMNPYLNTVSANAMQGLNQQRLMAQNTLADQAQAGNAYGGSRYALQAASTDAQAAQQAGNLNAQIYGQGFQNAQQMAQTDLARGLQAQGLNQSTNLQAQGMNQQAGLTAANLGLQGLTLAGNLTTAGQTANYRDLAALEAAGGSQQGLNQQYLDLQQQQWADARNYPLEQLQIMGGTLGGTPYGGTTTMTGPAGTKANPAMGALGGAMSGAASGAMMGSVVPGIGTAVGAVGGAILGGAGGYMSSR